MLLKTQLNHVCELFDSLVPSFIRYLFILSHVSSFFLFFSFQIDTH